MSHNFIAYNVHLLDRYQYAEPLRDELLVKHVFFEIVESATPDCNVMEWPFPSLPIILLVGCVALAHPNEGRAWHTLTNCNGHGD